MHDAFRLGHVCTDSCRYRQPPVRKPTRKPPNDRTTQCRPLHRPRLRASETKLAILQVNIRGLRSNTVELANSCSVKKPSIVIAVETFLDSTTPDGADCIQIPGYSLSCRRDCAGTTGGGTAVYCLEGISIYYNLSRPWLWAHVVHCCSEDQDAADRSCLPPPQVPPVMSWMDEFGAQSVMLIGDFNVHHQEWLGSNVTDAARRCALQLANCIGLDQIISEPTRGDNILDLVLPDTPATTKTLANIGSSDHNPVLIPLKISVFKHRVWRYDKAQVWGITGYLTSINWSSVFKEKDPERTALTYHLTARRYGSFHTQQDHHQKAWGRSLV